MYGDDLGSWYLLTIDKVFKINGAVATQVTGLPTDSAPIYLSLAYDNKGGWYLNYGDKLKNEAVGYRIDGTNAIYLPKVTAHTGIQYYIDSEGNWYYLDLVATGEYISSITGRISYLYRIDGDRTTQIKKDTITLCSYLYINTCKTKF